jgi:hypothetical protein
MRKTASRRMLLIRLVASPTLAPTASDALHRRLAADGKLLACVSDADVNATLISVKTADDDLRATVTVMAETIGATQAVGRAFRFELQHPDAAKIVSDESLRAVAVEVHGALRASVHIARRTVPAGRWTSARPMGWGADGLTLGDNAPTLPFGGSESSGVAIEVGGPTVIAKAKLTGGVPSSHMKGIAAAVGGQESGLTEVGAYPIAILRDGSAVFVLELSDPKRSPLHRALTLLEIEAQRFGARLGTGSLLSDAPLDTFLDVLAHHMGLEVARSQVIESHLARSPVSQ